MVVDRVGPDPLDCSGLGRVVTVRWPLTLGRVEGSLRLWLPEVLVARWLAAAPGPPADAPGWSARHPELSGTWRAEAGQLVLPRGVRTLRVGGVLPLAGSGLCGTPASPAGSICLTMPLTSEGSVYRIPAEPLPQSSGGLLTVTGPLRQEPTPREAIPVSATPANPSADAGAPADIPVTLVVELGRVNLSLGRLADLKPGDVIELGRHSREPVELTSGGKLVARAELVQIDTELGVRVTNVFL
jgi:flagellar motor switch protein FliN/FliY